MLINFKKVFKNLQITNCSRLQKYVHDLRNTHGFKKAYEF